MKKIYPPQEKTLLQAAKQMGKKIPFIIKKITSDRKYKQANNIINADIIEDDIVEIYQMRNDGNIIVLINRCRKVVMSCELAEHILVYDIS